MAAYILSFDPKKHVVHIADWKAEDAFFSMCLNVPLTRTIVETKYQILVTFFVTIHSDLTKPHFNSCRLEYVIICS